MRTYTLLAARPEIPKRIRVVSGITKSDGSDDCRDQVNNNPGFQISKTAGYGLILDEENESGRSAVALNPN